MKHFLVVLIALRKDHFYRSFRKTRSYCKKTNTIATLRLKDNLRLCILERIEGSAGN